MSDPRRPVDHALDALMNAFLELDRVHREAVRLVRDYRLFLPERAARSGLVPRHLHLDAQADALAAEYLNVLDHHPVERAMTASAQHQALAAFNHVGPRLQGLGAEFVHLLHQYAPEFRAVAQERERVQRRRALATAALERAHEAWNALRADGFEFRPVDEALARARIAGRALQEWTPEKSVSVLERVADAVDEASGQVVALADELPKKVRRLHRRTPSLRTRLEAIGTRMLGMDTAMTALRREFSDRNWRDLEEQPTKVKRLVAAGRELIKDIERAVSGQEWDVALGKLAEVEATMADADAAVDAPKERLSTLRSFRADPEPRFRKARFAVRDAQMLVMQTGSTSRFAGELDALASRLDHARGTLAGVHPDYWNVLVELDRIEAAVGRVVERQRGRTAPGPR